jgi:hypothetical protein
MLIFYITGIAQLVSEKRQDERDVSQYGERVLLFCSSRCVDFQDAKYCQVYR